ncbi:hypothetical protein [Acinetobacter johnsonii]|uniref:hypothetical protein n=1 Tax=Acinetobacter johnsonii TaxID=40214 RepID=UPI002447EF9F|nr:hypothetical protein [Acinetobacter johnsonii]MDH1406196.1 hypothetical protein [Acinetobacter johnsonii]
MVDHENLYSELQVLVPVMQSRSLCDIQGKSAHSKYHFDHSQPALHFSETQAPNDSLCMWLYMFGFEVVHLG